jgi:hypothetical protein
MTNVAARIQNPGLVFPYCSDPLSMERVPGGYVIRRPARQAALLDFHRGKNHKTTASRRGFHLFRRPCVGRPTLLAIGAAALQLFCSVADATTIAKPAVVHSAMGGFVKDRALARILGETLFRDTVDVMSDPANQRVAVQSPADAPAITPAAVPNAAQAARGTPNAAMSTTVPGSTTASGLTTAPGSAANPRPGLTRDNSAVAQVARTVLAQRKLDKYLWLIQQAYDDTLWKGGDRARIEQHFPLIWRTSIMLYEASLNASPHRVRVCSPADNGDGFDCRDEIARARVVPIPSQAPLVSQPHPAITG